MANMDEKTLYSPCIAAHSPTSLQKVTSRLIAEIIVFNSVPSEIVSYNDYSQCKELCRLKLDEILLGAKDYKLWHKLMKNRLKEVKIWWENCSWFGSWDSPIRRAVQGSISELLDNMDYYAISPLFIFTCQLCYVRDAGLFNPNSKKIILKVPKRYCHQYATLLNFLGPFHIRRLFNPYMIFGNPEPLVVIFKNAPELKVLNLRYNSGDYTFFHLSRHCKKLERFIVTDIFGMICVSESFLYQTFFCGLEKQQIMGDDAIKPNLSFPNLSYIDIGRGKVAQEFLCILSHYYPGILSLSCNSPNLDATYLLQASSFFTEKFTSYNIEDLSLTRNCVLNAYVNKFFKYFPKLKHITLILDPVSEEQMPTYRDKVTQLLKLSPSSLKIFIPFDSLLDEEIVTVFQPIFKNMGTKLKALQFFISRKVSTPVVCCFLSMCPNLELLSIHLDIDGNLTNFIEFSRPKLSQLKSFSVRYDDDTCLLHFLNFIESIITKSPNITSLELILQCEASSWILDVAAKGLLSNLTTLILNMTPIHDGIDVDFYVVLVEALTLLTRLVLIGVGPEVLSHTQSVFHTAALEVIAGKNDNYIAYHGIHSQYWW